MRTDDWMRQAEKDLAHAKRDCENRDFEWACFSSQQAAEKAVKALYQNIHNRCLEAFYLKDALRPSSRVEAPSVLDR